MDKNIAAAWHTPAQPVNTPQQPVVPVVTVTTLGVAKIVAPQRSEAAHKAWSTRRTQK